MRKILYITAIIILLLVINGLAHSIYDLWQKRDLLTLAQKALEEEKAKNQKFKTGLSTVQNPEFIESEARNKLFLVKEGEKEVIIPVASKSATEKKEQSLPNWQKWLKLFF